MIIKDKYLDLTKYFDLARELKKQWHMKVTLIPIEDSSLETVS